MANFLRLPAGARRFVNADKTLFFDFVVDRLKVVCHYGQVGQAGAMNTVTMPDAQTVRDYVAKLMTKLSTGYVEVTDGESRRLWQQAGTHATDGLPTRRYALPEPSVAEKVPRAEITPTLPERKPRKVL